MEVYLDNSATTCLCSHAVEKMTFIMNNVYGNPSSLHSKGMEAENEIKFARKIIAELLGVNNGEVYFTSGGTEANNLAVFGAAHAKNKLGNKIVTTAVEHSSVYESCKALETEGFEVVYLKPDLYGNITETQLREAIDDKTILVSVMFVNNETGAVLPVDKISKIIQKKKSPALFHCDAVQAFGKIPVKPRKINCDLLTVTAHKIHGPKGVGALYIKEKTNIKPILHGGEQQKKIRPGTEPVILIGGFGAAAADMGNISQNYKKVSELHDYAIKTLTGIEGIVLNSSEQNFPYIINLSALGIKSETMLHFLEDKGIYLSSGSACAKGKKSHVLTAMGLPTERIDSALRISFSKNSSKEEVDLLSQALCEGLNTLVRKARK